MLLSCSDDALPFMCIHVLLMLYLSFCCFPVSLFCIFVAFNLLLSSQGHKSYVPNMISGASQADIGVLVNRMQLPL
uniref:Uncharacterized protein n=1 Tax=Arundo donax TaxID=35708 RepID=A0A0A9CZF6_ARUDO